MNARAHHSACGRRLLVREDGSQLVRRQQVGARHRQQLLMLRLHLRMELLLLVLVLVQVLVLVLVPLVIGKQVATAPTAAPIAAPAPVKLRRIILRIHAGRQHAKNCSRCAKRYSHGRCGQRPQRVHGVGRCEARRRVAVPAGGAL